MRLALAAFLLVIVCFVLYSFAFFFLIAFSGACLGAVALPPLSFCPQFWHVRPRGGIFFPLKGLSSRPLQSRGSIPHQLYPEPLTTSVPPSPRTFIPLLNLGDWSVRSVSILDALPSPPRIALISPAIFIRSGSIQTHMSEEQQLIGRQKTQLLFLETHL